MYKNVVLYNEKNLKVENCRHKNKTKHKTETNMELCAMLSLFI